MITAPPPPQALGPYVVALQSTLIRKHVIQHWASATLAPLLEGNDGNDGKMGKMEWGKWGQSRLFCKICGIIQTCRVLPELISGGKSTT